MYGVFGGPMDFRLYRLCRCVFVHNTHLGRTADASWGSGNLSNLSCHIEAS